LIFSQQYLGCLSHASYLIGDETTGRAVVVDPRRDIDVYLEEAAAKGLRIERVIETHLHADFLSGHLELADATGAVISFGEAAQVEFPIDPLTDGQRIALGEVTLEIRATPGHTPESICVLVFEHPGDATPFGILTGDTLFVGDVGRPDLLASSGSGFTADALARLLYRSLHERILDLPDETQVFPAHGAGSSCGKQLSSETSSTLGEQRRSNYALAPMTEAEFVAAVTEGQPTRPHYFSFDAKRNREARGLLDEHLPPDPLDLDEVLGRQRDGALALDTREPADFAAGHLRGAINVGLQGRFAEWAGDVLDPDADVVLVGDPSTALETRVRLARIGFDRVVGYLGEPALLMSRPDLVEASSRLTIEQLSELMGQQPDLQIVDVRNPGETAGGTLPGARVVPLPVLVDSLDDMDRRAPVVVNCAGGSRSVVASSVLRQAGFDDVSDLLGGYGAWSAAGLPVSIGDAGESIPVEEVDADSAAALIRSGSVLVDVREQDEWEGGHAPDAVLIPMSQVERRIAELDGCTRPVVVACRSGGRSAVITRLLGSHGIEAVNLTGGLRAWVDAGLPVVTNTRDPGRII
jgi:rhodanese-related sulfurtransferase/glyoxylase-like metal-dependent hydrolase (beta-lactamase superfamily II)